MTTTTTSATTPTETTPTETTPTETTPTTTTPTETTPTTTTPTTTTPTTAATARRRRLQIDWTRCDGHGLCAAILPGAVARDDWGYPVIDDAALDLAPASAVRRAISACPALALRDATMPA